MALFVMSWYPLIVPSHCESSVRVEMAIKWLKTLVEMGWIKHFVFDYERGLPALRITIKEGIEVAILQV